MRRTFIFTIAGILISGLKCVDLSRGVFLIQGPMKDIYSLFSFLFLISLCVVSTFMLPLKNRLLFFLLIGIYFVIHHAVWFSMGQALGEQEIPIKESIPYFEKGYQYYMKWIYEERIEFHTHVFMKEYICFIIIMAMTLMVQKVVKAFIDHHKK